MRKFFERLYVAIAAFVWFAITAMFVALGLLAAQTPSGRVAWVVAGALLVVHMTMGFYHETTGRRLVAWWPIILPWTKSLLVKFSIVLPLFAFTCYLLVYMALVQITGTRPEWLEP